MKEYPTEITKEILDKQSHISDGEIKQDIAETETEIFNMEKEAEAYALLGKAHKGTPEARMDYMRESARRSGIQERKDFVRFLKQLLEARQATTPKGGG